MISCPHCGHVLVSREPLTPRQSALYGYLYRRIQQDGFAPSQKEIGQHFGYTSRGTVVEALRRLEQKGYIRRSRHEQRAITCLVHPDEIGAVAPSMTVRK